MAAACRHRCTGLLPWVALLWVTLLGGCGIFGKDEPPEAPQGPSLEEQIKALLPPQPSADQPVPIQLASTADFGKLQEEVQKVGASLAALTALAGATPAEAGGKPAEEPPKLATAADLQTTGQQLAAQLEALQARFAALPELSTEAAEKDPKARLATSDELQHIRAMLEALGKALAAGPLEPVDPKAVATPVPTPAADAPVGVPERLGALDERLSEIEKSSADTVAQLRELNSALGVVPRETDTETDTKTKSGSNSKPGQVDEQGDLRTIVLGIQDQLAFVSQDADSKLDKSQTTVGREVQRMGMWFPQELSTGERWVQTSKKEAPPGFGDMILQSLVSNVLLVPLVLLALIGLLILLQKVRTLGDTLAKTKKGLGSIQRQMGLEEPS